MLRNTALKLLLPRDLVLYKLGWRSKEEAPGYVCEVRGHEVDIEDARTLKRYTIKPGAQGKVQKLTGSQLQQVLTALQGIRTAIEQRGPRKSRTRPKRSAPPVAKLGPLTSTPPVHAPLRRPEPRGTVPTTLPRPLARIEDPDYLAWLQTLDCDGCGPMQRTQTEAAHNGPRGVSKKTHDYRANPLCNLCHKQHHRWRTLPGLTPEESLALLFERQVYLLLRYFAVPLGALAERWYMLAELADGMDLDGRTEHYTTLLDLMVQPLSTLQGVHHVAAA